MGQVQSRQQDETYFKLDAKDKDTVIKEYTGTLSCLVLIVLFSFSFCAQSFTVHSTWRTRVSPWVLMSNDRQEERGKSNLTSYNTQNRNGTSTSNNNSSNDNTNGNNNRNREAVTKKKKDAPMTEWNK